MDTDRWTQIKKVFREALSLERDKRKVFLDEACGDDPMLLKEVEALIAAHEESESFLETPVDAGLSPADDEAVELPANTRIGQYTLQEKISTGGMGTVYKAEQESPRRTVALKVMREGIVSKAALRRFEYEAQILAGLDHPNIARVIESGTHRDPAVGDAPGMPYFVMEYIEGASSLTQYAWSREMKASARMRLFLQVCEAVHHGHRKGVIHRDLKPSNLLVDASGKVKIIDFGVARATDSDLAMTTVHTAVGQLIGTLQYMSPEQCKADPREIDIRSDVYSLGVVLYELLCEELPYDVRKAVVFEATRIIRETEPRRPSTVNRTLQRDVETIVLKALEKDRNQRYQDVAELAEDIRRFLCGDVILAKPTGIGTRAWKLVKKNPVVSGALALTALTILCSLAYFMFISYPQLKQERDFAREQQEIAVERYEQIIRLSDVKTLSDLEAEADKLWPTHPENIPELSAWMERADQVIARMDLHKETLGQVRGQALPFDEQAEQRDREKDPKWREYIELKEARDDVTDMIAEQEDVARKDNLNERLEEIKNRIATLETEFEKRRIWIFPVEGMDWQHNTLTFLVERLQIFRDGVRNDVAQRLEFAETVVQRTIDDHGQLWDEAVATIENEGYDGLQIEPKIGLVPLGRDPDSRLWEFAHLQTGTIPERDADGKLRLTGESGLVFVLIPGGSFDMGSRLPSEEHPIGSPNVDPQMKEDDGPVHRVTVAPFYLSKYEMTQGQWLRVTRENPSMYRPPKIMGGRDITLLNPVEQVTWNDCVAVLDRLKLRLPSESEWEYAARAGTTTVYYTGEDEQSLAGSLNICDQYAKDHNGPPTWKYSLWLNDGHLVHAPVGIYKANPFGLHDVLGNLYEWCQDSFGGYDEEPRDGSARMTRRTALHIRRGGCWVSSPFFCRSSHRYGGDATYMNNTLGLRPAISVR